MKKLSTQILRNASIVPSTTNAASRRLFSTSTVANKKKVDIKYTKLFIGGQFVEGKEGKKFSVINPATEEEICQVSEATKADVDEAVKVARATFENVWRNYSPHQRSILMNRWADLIERDADYIADLESLDNGKPREMSRNVDVAMTISTIRYFAGWADKINGDTIPLEGDYFCYTQREPVGVCAQIGKSKVYEWSTLCLQSLTIYLACSIYLSLLNMNVFDSYFSSMELPIVDGNLEVDSLSRNCKFLHMDKRIVCSLVN